MNTIASYALCLLVGAAVGGTVMWLLDFRILRGAMCERYALGVKHGREQAHLAADAEDDTEDEEEKDGAAAEPRQQGRTFVILGATPAIRARIGAGVWTRYIADASEESTEVWQ